MSRVQQFPRVVARAYIRNPNALEGLYATSKSKWPRACRRGDSHRDARGLCDAACKLVRPAAPAVAPENAREPGISGTTRVGQMLRSTRGTWTGTEPISTSSAGTAATGAGRPTRPTAGGSRTPRQHVLLRQADAGLPDPLAGRRTQRRGQDTATSNPTNVVNSAKPVNTTEPSISGTAAVGNRLAGEPGQWAGERPITYAYVWLRCNDKGDNCARSRVPTTRVRGARSRHRPDDARPGHRPERARLDSSDLDSRRRSSVEAATRPRAADPGGRPEGGRRSSRRRLGQFIAEPGDEPDGADHGACPGHGPGGRPVSGALRVHAGRRRASSRARRARRRDGVVTLTLVRTRCSRSRATASTCSSSSRRTKPGDPGSAELPATGSCRSAWPAEPQRVLRGVAAELRTSTTPFAHGTGRLRLAGRGQMGRHWTRTDATGLGAMREWVDVEPDEDV